MSLLLAVEEPGDALAILVPLAAAAVLVLAVWRSVRQATTEQRRRERVADHVARGDLDGACAELHPLEPAAQGRALAGAAALLVERARPARPTIAYDDEEDEDEEDEDEEDEEQEAPPRLNLEPRVAASIPTLVRRALEAAPGDGRTLCLAATALTGLGAAEAARAVLADAARAEELSRADLVDLTRVASAAAPDLVQSFAEPALRLRPDDIELIELLARALVDLDRPAEALPWLESGLEAVRLKLGSIDAHQHFEAYVAAERSLSELHDEVVRRTETAEKVIDAHVRRGRLDLNAGVNYKLIAHSLLVESTRRARRLLLPSQAELLRDAEADPDGVAGLEDAGLHALREGAFERAEERFRRAADLAPGGWPVLAGLGATLDLRKAPAWSAHPAGPSLPALARIVEPWGALTEVERNLVALALAPVAHLVPALADAGGKLQVAALDAKLTDLPAFRAGAGTVVEHEDDRRTHDAIDGMAVGLTAAIKVEAFHERDEEGWVLAHELGHVLQCFLETRAGDQAEAFTAELDALFAEAERVSWRSTEYGLRNVFEFFATGYERFALRHAFPDAPRSETHGADIDLGVDAFLRKWTAP